MLLTVSLFCFTIIETVNCGWFFDDEDENQNLNILKARAEEIIPESDEFMKQDKYLLRWLEAYDNNLDNTIHELEKTVKWRKENNISTIMYENFTATLGLEYPYILDGSVDKEGRPILQITMGHYNLRKIALAGRTQILVRYITMTLELLERYMYYRRIVEGNTNVSQGILIFDIQGFNMATTACYECLKIAPEMIPVMDNYYSGIFYRMYYINTPRIFDVMMRAIQLVMKPRTKKSLVVFDNDKEKWKKALLEIIPPQSLRELYGGIIPERHPNPTAVKDIVIKFMEDTNSKKFGSSISTTTGPLTTSSAITNSGHLGEIHGTHHHHHHVSSHMSELSNTTSVDTDHTDISIVTTSEDYILQSNEFLTDETKSTKNLGIARSTKVYKRATKLPGKLEPQAQTNKNDTTSTSSNSTSFGVSTFNVLNYFLIANLVFVICFIIT